MKPNQLKLIQAFADLIIPLLGYFWWNWSFYFILLFFMLDFLVFCVFSFVKVKKINTHLGVRNDFPIRNLIFSVLAIAVSLVATLHAMSLVDPDFNVVSDTWSFLTYKDMGIAQGIVLLPLLVYAGYMQYKMQFLMNGNFTVLKPADIWRTHFVTVLAVLLVSGLFLGISFWVTFPQLTYILVLSIGVVLFRFFYTR